MNFLIEIIFWVRKGREEGLPAFGVTTIGVLTPGPACGCVGKEDLAQDPLPSPTLEIFNTVVVKAESK